MRYLVFQLILVIVLIAKPFAQDFNYRFKHLTNKDGLSNSSINSIYQDRYGFMWFSTLNGLNRYNGYEIERFKQHPDKDYSIAQNSVKFVYGDSRERIWIVYSAPGLSYFDPKTEIFVNFYPNPDSLGLFDAPVNFIYEDKDQTIWICTDNGICVFNEYTRSFSQVEINFNNKSYINFAADYMVQVSNGLLWIASQHRISNGQGILIYDPVNNNYNLLDTQTNTNLPTNKFTFIFEDTHKNIWLGSHEQGAFRLSKGYDLTNIRNWNFDVYINYKKDHPNFKRSHIIHINEVSNGDIWFSTNLGLAKMENPNSKTPQLQFFLYQKKSGVGDNPINKSIEDNFGNVWAIPDALNAGLFKYEISTGKHEVIKSEKYNENSISSDKFTDIYIDNQDIIWLATGNNGIDMLDLNQKRFSTYRSNLGIEKTLSSDKIFGMDEDKNGNIWIATYKGLNCFSPKSETFRHFNNDIYPGLLNQDEIFEVFCDHTNKLWIGYLRILLSRFDPVSYTNFKYTETENFGNNFLGWSVRTIIEDTKNNLWIGSNGSGLWHYDRSKDHFNVFMHDPDTNSVNSNQIFALLEDNEGTIWIGTKNNGINRYHPHKNYFESFTHNPSDSASLSDNQIMCLTEGQNQTLWIGSAESGLIKLDKSSLVFSNYTQDDGLCDNMVKGILIDDLGNLWLSTNNGLAKFDPVHEIFTSFTSEDGIQGNEFNILSYLKSSDGKMYFGGTKGLTVFTPEEIQTNPYTAKPVIHKISLFNQPIHVGEEVNNQVVLKNSILNTKKIKLNHKNNVFSLGFTALHYSSPDKINFHYKLEGFESKWNIVDATRREATYTNLDPSTYTFRLKATNNDGLLSDEEAVLLIEIEPAWWETKLFSLVLFITTILAVFLWIRVRTYRLKTQKSELKKQVDLRTKELSEQNTVLVKKQNELIQKNDEISAMSKKIHDLNQARMRFFTNISHEFKTPLTLMISPTEKLLNLPEIQSSDDIRKSVHLIYKNEKRLLNLINQLLEIRKIETGTMKLKVSNGDPVEFLTEIGNLFIESANENQIHFTIQCSNGMKNDRTVYYFDKDKLEKIAFNLLSNAFKYTSANGNVKLVIHIVNSDLQLQVIDSGKGIKYKDIDKIFERFNNLNNTDSTNYDSAGVGLSYVKDLVEIHKGEISVKSKPDKGTTFSVSLPLSKSRYNESEIVSNESSIKASVAHYAFNEKDIKNTTKKINQVSHDSKKFNLLIIEDNKDLRDLLIDELNPYFNTFEAADGDKGLIKATDIMPDIILSDVMMPGMDGVTLCDRLKTNDATSHIPIVLLTAKSAEEAQIDGIEKGADDYITKPFNMNVLRAKLINIIAIREKLKSQFAKETSLLPESLASTNKDAEFLQETVELIKNNMQDSNLNAEKLANELKVSRSFLYKKIDALSGQSVNEFIRLIRLKASVELMQTSKLTLSEIAYSVGFTSLNYFSKSFKKQFNITPSEFLSKKITSF